MNSPAEILQNYIPIARQKVSFSLGRMLLSMLAGMFVAMACMAASSAAAGMDTPARARLVSALVFPGGLSMVMLAGSELFTGNSLLVIPLMEGQITWRAMLRSWTVVYLGNLLGSAAAALLAVYSGQLGLYGGALAVAGMRTAADKCALPFVQALLQGTACNFLVCIAVWIGLAARDAAGKVLGLFFPILMFVVCGFEHSVANMFYISAGIFSARLSPYGAMAAQAGVDLSLLTWGNMFFRNLLPVTLGNLIGGVLLVGLPYWLVYGQDAFPAED